ncbi:MAG: glutamate-5-semialdehyde dehydrogenase [Deltaproteobacteria bacterium]|nr:glutamate-5-semialdehyde dehydrogenase [Deltaproteobacteria bacterium]
MTTELEAQVGGLRAAQRRLAAAPAAARSAALSRLGQLLGERAAEIATANDADRAEAQESALAPELMARLTLSAAKLAALRDGIGQLSRAPDPIGAVTRKTELDRGLVLTEIKGPIGVLLVVFESRPDAVAQIGSLAIRSANGIILKGGSEARRSNRALGDCLHLALSAAGLPAEAVLMVEERTAVAEILKLDELVDVVIPRGSKTLVHEIKRATRIPVLGHAEGVCHVYIDKDADPEMATRIVLDGKCDYPAACNATEAVLVHQDAVSMLPALGAALRAAGVELRADDRARAHLEGARAATAADWGTEFGALILAVRVVDDLDQAIAHIARYGSAHTDAIVTDDEAAAKRFIAAVDSASVFHNASTRMADGYRYGLGAEVGISTARIHARGPMGVEGLLTGRWVLRGHGQGAGDYGPGKRAFVHRPLPID